MRKEPVLGLAGLILTGVLGCETNRPYCSRCMLARNNYAQAETAYRPKTVVTMRAEEVPESPAAVPGSACPTVQLVGATATPVAQAPSQATGSAPMVTVTIPAMKIVIPMTATAVTPPTPVKETSTVTQLPATVGSVVQASSTASVASSSSNASASEPELHPAVHIQKEEVAASPSTTANPTSMTSTPIVSNSTITESPPLPEPIPEPKPKSKSAKNDKDSARLPRLSLLPPDPPPDVPMHRTTAPAPAFRMTEPPPPPPVPKSSSSSGPVLPSEEPELR